MDSGYSGESGEKWSDSDSVLKVEPLGLRSIREGVNEREMSFWSEPELQEMQSGVAVYWMRKTVGGRSGVWFWTD